MNKDRQRKLEAKKRRQESLANFGAQFQNPRQEKNNNDIDLNDKGPKLQGKETVKNLGSKTKKNKKHLQDNLKKKKTVKGKEKSL